MRKIKRAGMREMERGFTLLEILIAIFIFALIVSAVLGVYGGTLAIMDETETEEDIYQKARIAMERITADLRAAYLTQAAPSPQTGPQEPDEVLFHGEAGEIGGLSCGELRFASLAHLDFSHQRPPGESSEISYYGETDEGEGVLRLYRSDTSVSRERPESGTGGVILCSGLLSVQFTYYDADGQPHEEWNSKEAPFKGRLPARVAVRMEFSNPRDVKRPLRFMTGVAIPMGG